MEAGDVVEIRGRRDFLIFCSYCTRSGRVHGPPRDKPQATAKEHAPPPPLEFIDYKVPLTVNLRSKHRSVSAIYEIYEIYASLPGSSKTRPRPVLIGGKLEPHHKSCFCQLNDLHESCISHSTGIIRHQARVWIELRRPLQSEREHLFAVRDLDAIPYLTATLNSSQSLCWFSDTFSNDAKSSSFAEGPARSEAHFDRR